MFTGLIASVGRVERVDAGADGSRLEIASGLAGELAPGDSVAVDGVCLTATAADGGGFAVEVMGQTLRRSTLGAARPGRTVNLEPALRATDRLGGHVVQGHVDGVGAVRGARDDGFARVLEVAAPDEVLRYVVARGSVAVDGVSLTVASLADDAFTVSLIPETRARTALGGAESGQPVNLEADVLAKYVERLMRR